MNRFGGWLGLIAAVALALRAAHAVSLLRSPLGGVLVLDARYYHLEALRLLGIAGDGAASPVGFMNVGYPYLLAAIYAVAGPGIATVIGVQAVLGSLTAVVLALAVRRLAGRDDAALVAALLYAFYGQAVFYDALLLTPCAVNAALAATLWALAEWQARRRGSADGAGEPGFPWPALWAGVGVGLASLLRASNLLFLPLLSLVLLLPRRAAPPGRRLAGGAGRAVTGLLGGACLLVLPVVAYNGIANGQWVPVTANGGMNFWVGNNPDAHGAYYAAEFLGNQDAEGEHLAYLREARRRSGDDALDLAASSSYWFGDALDAIAARPWAWIRLELRKAAFFWNAAEAKTNVSKRFVELFSPVLARATLGFAPIAILGLAGLAWWFAGPRRDAAWLAACWVAVPWITSLAFFVSGEYRHPASLALCAGAAAILVELGARLKRVLGRERQAAAAGSTRRPAKRSGGLSGGEGRASGRALLSALVAGTLVTPLALRGVPQLEWGNHPDLDFWNASRAIAKRDARDAAELRDKHRQIRELLDHPAARREGSLMLDDARFEAFARSAEEQVDAEAARLALESARELLALDPRLVVSDLADNFTRYVYRSVPQRIAALGRLEVVERDPELSREAGLLGARGYREVAELLEAGEPHEARAFLLAALERSPHDPRLSAELGRLLLREGDVEAGLRRLEAGCNGWPAIPECAYYAALFFAERGDLARAGEMVEEALRRDPGFTPAADLRGDLAAGRRPRPER